MTKKSGKYSCEDYRAEMTLLGLKHRLENGSLTEDERENICQEILGLEKEIGID